MPAEVGYDTTGDGKVDRIEYDTNHDGQINYVEFDLNGDGLANANRVVRSDEYAPKLDLTPS